VALVVVALVRLLQLRVLMEPRTPAVAVVVVVMLQVRWALEPLVVQVLSSSDCQNKQFSRQVPATPTAPQLLDFTMSTLSPLVTIPSRLVSRMAHYAYIDENNIVTQVIVGPDEGTEPEGIESWEDYFSAKGKGQALRTSYNTLGGEHLAEGTPFRMNYAGIGFTYDADRDAFIPPKPFPSWVLDDDTCLWEAPVPYPTDGEAYIWDEDAGDWVAVPNE
jgi:hypothetical protein